MIRFTRAFAAIVAVPLAACAQVPPVDDTPAMGAGQCDASKLGDLIGKTATSALVADARTRSMSRTVRVIKPGMAVTMDYRTDRLNIDVTERNVVTAARCG
ncbi:I78 family peptidase inhibitor [Sphingomonas sp. AX6]|uniref:I78 family peptidase inhibitor n=1 Tax=Sphingomonas sp. AX6 TaxID=2653171 RepID=UPI0012F2FF8B|nr:I78 family peptidase inhibitor [Sphingomonas sp. AX6]VXC92274.1 conserved exported hypothetical protein [Sphingomonas sp. AX6]